MNESQLSTSERKKQSNGKKQNKAQIQFEMRYADIKDKTKAYPEHIE